MEQDVVYKAIIVMVTDPDIDQNLFKAEEAQVLVIDYALHFSEMFYRNEVGNLIEYFEKMHNKEIHRKFFILDTEIKNTYIGFIHSIIDTYSKKITDQVPLLPFKERKNILQNTLNGLKTQFAFLLEGMVKNLNYDEEILKKIYDEHLKIIKNIEERLTNSGSGSTLLQFIRKAKMNYILDINDKFMVYPFVYDLLLHSFLIDTRLNQKTKSYTENKDIFNTLEQIRKDSNCSPEDQRYINIEYLKIAQILAYIDPDDLKQFLLFHYSKVLNSDYQNVLSVFKQFRHMVTDHHKYEYPYKDFSFIPIVASQDFRHLSLRVL
jgi:hypothetical protein